MLFLDKRSSEAASERELVVKTWPKDMLFDELKQLSRVTSATSFGSANSMSTHYGFIRASDACKSIYVKRTQRQQKTQT